MKVISTKSEIYEIVETDEKTYPTYRRFSDGHWQNLIAGDWIDVENFHHGYEVEIEEAYRDFKSQG